MAEYAELAVDSALEWSVGAWETVDSQLYSLHVTCVCILYTCVCGCMSVCVPKTGVVPRGSVLAVVRCTPLCVGVCVLYTCV